ncbi:hypothetical protein ACVGOW_16590 [Pseudonocardia saturnea]
MTCYLRLHEVAIAVHRPPQQVDWDEVARRWIGSDGVAGRDAALEAMPVTLVELDDLPAADLDGYAGLVLSGRSDQRLLAGMADRLAGLLDRGGVVVFSGQLTAGWLPGAQPFARTAAPDTAAPDTAAPDTAAPDTAAPGATGAPLLAAHPVFAGVDPADLGASFLYADGWHEPPPGAEVIARRADGTPGAWVARTGAGGAVLVHGGANLLANATTGSSAARIVPQLVEWVAARPVAGVR